MISYASMTQGARNLAMLRRCGWRVLVSPAHKTLDAQGFPYALDNGAWAYHQQGRTFDGLAFKSALEQVGAGADFVVVPDIVCGGEASLSLSLSWLDRVMSVAKVSLIAVQDGMDPQRIKRLLGPRVGVFVGGSTEWKLASMKTWCDVANECGAWCHVGRVNSMRRIHKCGFAGATSFDGTSPTKFSVTTPRLTKAANAPAHQGYYDFGQHTYNEKRTR